MNEMYSDVDVDTGKHLIEQSSVSFVCLPGDSRRTRSSISRRCDKALSSPRVCFALPRLERLDVVAGVNVAADVVVVVVVVVDV